MSLREELKSLIGTSEKSGNFSITLAHVADKRVTFQESVNGINHEHSWYKLEDAKPYIEFKKSVFNQLNQNSGNIDLENVSTEFRQQLSNLKAVESEIKNYILDLSNVKNESDIELDAGNVAIQDGATAKLLIKFQSYEDAPILELQNTATSIVDEESLHWITILSDLGKSVYSHYKLKRLLWQHREFSRQLQKFTTLKSNVTITESFASDIYEFITNAQDGDMFVYDLAEVNEYSRRLEFRRLSRVKYIAEIVASSEDKEWFEYWTYFKKFGSNVSGNVDQLRKIIKAFHG